MNFEEQAGWKPGCKKTAASSSTTGSKPVANADAGWKPTRRCPGAYAARLTRSFVLSYFFFFFAAPCSAATSFGNSRSARIAAACCSASLPAMTSVASVSLTI